MAFMSTYSTTAYGSSSWARGLTITGVWIDDCLEWDQETIAARIKEANEYIQLLENNKKELERILG